MASVIGWGNNAFGQIGELSHDNDDDDENADAVLLPRKIDFLRPFSSLIVSMACGWHHTVFCTTDGLVYANGCNDHGQLGYHSSSEEKIHRTPSQVTCLATHNIVKVGCGKRFTVFVNHHGGVYCCGDNSKGQLGTDVLQTLGSATPRHVKGIPAHVQIVSVSCGKNHTLALSSGGEVYCWGGNKYGQCGVGVKSEDAVLPHHLDYLLGAPVYAVAAGGNHSIAVTVSGMLISWGRNGFGQLGLGDTIDRVLPTKNKVLDSKPVCRVACGEAHTLVLTGNGGVYSFGAGSAGQLGHGVFKDEHNPKKIYEFMGTTITQIACGRKHSIAYTSYRLYSFGLGASGQLGHGATERQNTPTIVKGNWDVDIRVMDEDIMKDVRENVAYFEEDLDETVALIKSTIGNDTDQKHGCSIQEVFAGGLTSFITTVDSRGRDSLPCFHSILKQGNVLFLTESIARKMVTEVIPEDASFSILSTVFSNVACLNASFLKRDSHCQTSAENPGLHLNSVRNALTLLGSKDSFKKVIINCLKDLLGQSFNKLLQYPETLRVFIMLPELPFFTEVPDEVVRDVIVSFAHAFLALRDSAQDIIMKWWGKLPATFFERHVVSYNMCIHNLLEEKLQPEKMTNSNLWSLQESVNACLAVLERLDAKNNEHAIVPYTSFYIDCLPDKINILHDYINWIKQPLTFSFCKYPFALNVCAKAELLQIDADRQMHDAVRHLHIDNMTNFMHGKQYCIQPEPMLVFHIRRDHIVEDTLSQILMHNPHEMKRPLKIKFSEEEAEDAGGVKKEFFLLLMKEILDPKYGMFDYHEDSGVMWFRSHSFEDSVMFMLIGVMCGLAIYNTTIIDFPFPVCLYKKLLDKPVNLDDLRGVEPAIAKSLQEILDYHQEDFVDVFDLNFQVTEQSYGESYTVDLIPKGGDTMVTIDNKTRYVNAYIDYCLCSSVKKPFEAFKDGFMRVCGGPVLELFRPQELMEFVVGSQAYDFSELQLTATYKGEYHPSHPVIVNFWDVLRSFSMDMKKKFLIYLTGSDKISVFGMKNMRFVIQPVNVSEDHLPVAHTCFNLLDLPLYSTREILMEKLGQAIENFQGFALV